MTEPFHIADGEDTDPFSPINRATEKLVVDGKPLKVIHQCMVHPWSGDRTLRWFGVHVVTYADRLVFFPGLATAQLGVSVSRGRQAKEHPQFLIDHITLEPDLKTWHITSPNSQHHIGRFSTKPLGEGRIVWMSLGIQQPSALHLAHEKTTRSVDVPESDSDRRVAVLMNARENVVFNVLDMPERDDEDPNNTFPYFCFIVGPPGFTSPDPPYVFLPVDHPYINGELPPEMNRVPIRQHRLRLLDSYDVEVNVYWLPGSIEVPMILSSPE